MDGTARVKRLQWLRKKIFDKEMKKSIKRSKSKFQRKLRNGRCNEFALRGNSYRRITGGNAKSHYMP